MATVLPVQRPQHSQAPGIHRDQGPDHGFPAVGHTEPVLGLSC